MPLTRAQTAAKARIMELEAEFSKHLDEQVKNGGADARCIATAKTNMQQARLWANEGVCGPLAKYAPDEDVAVVAAAASSSSGGQ